MLRASQIGLCSLLLGLIGPQIAEAGPKSAVEKGGAESADGGDAGSKEVGPAEGSPSVPGTGTGTKKSAGKGKSKGKGAKAGKKGKSQRAPKAKECDYRSPLHLHEVVEGEHLGLIAGQYGVFSKDVLRWNPQLENPDLIKVGQKLNICPELPPREELHLTHVVESGETLGAIANKYSLSLEELLEQQGGAIKDPDDVWAGTELKVTTFGEILPAFKPEPEPVGRSAKRISKKLQPKPHIYIKRPKLAYGTSRTIQLLDQTLAKYYRRVGGPRINVGDISQQGGGKLKGHLSHRRGVDVDIGLVLKGEHANKTRFAYTTPETLDVKRTWALVHEFLRSGEVRYIFLDYKIQKQLYEYAREHGVSPEKLDEYFQYPRGRGRNHGIVRHWKGHRNHIHVRFR